MDIIDLAQTNDELFRQSALTAFFRRRADNGDTMRHHVPIIRAPHTCLDCGEEIEPARLEAKPDAVRCRDCQEKHERRTRPDV